MTTQPNTEPLKVGELKPCPFCGSPATHAGHDDVRCSNSQCGMAHESVSLYAWNRRTEPSPAEVSSEGLPGLTDSERNGIEEVTRSIYEKYLSQQSPATTPELIRYGKGHPASCICSLCKQSPATVEGELTDGEILKLFDSAIDAARLATDSKWSLHQAGSNEHDCRMRSVFESIIIEKRRAIERALNQRLAVKEGEGLECIGTLSECPVSGMFVYLNDNIERQYEGAAVYVVRSIEKDAQ